MNHHKLAAIGPVLLAGLISATQASAQSDRPDQSVQIVAETQDFSDGQGSLRSVTLEYKFDAGDTTVLFTPAIGERRAGAIRDTSLGGGVTVYHDWSETFSTRSEVFISEDEPVFAHREIAQDLTLKVAHSTTMTLGGRWAQYAGGRDVAFLSLGARRYFRGGSVAYRLTLTDPEGQGSFVGHLFNLSLSDGGTSTGKTQLWLSAGESSLNRSLMVDTFSGEDYAAMLKRTQPLTSQIALIAGAGVASYDRPAGRITSTTFDLGLSFGIR